jgi:hypothetical protein
MGTDSAGDAMLTLISLKVFVGFRVVFPKLFDDVLARVTVVFLHSAGYPQLIFRWNGSHFTTLTQ